MNRKKVEYFTDKDQTLPFKEKDLVFPTVFKKWENIKEYKGMTLENSGIV